MKLLRILLVCLPVFFIVVSVVLLLPADVGELQTLKDMGSSDWTFHTYAGLIAFIFFIAILLISQLKKRSSGFNRYFSSFTAGLNTTEMGKIKWWSMITLGSAGIYAYVYCHHLCETGGVPIFDHNINFFHMLFRYSLSLFPYFILGCIFGGFIMKYLAAGRLKLPTNMLSAGIFAAIIPVCACGAVPLAQGMLATGRVRVRAVITFLMIAPVLSPVVIPFSFQLGPAYAITRIVAIFVLAFVTGVIVEKFAGVKESDNAGVSYSCQGCAASGGVKSTNANSALITGWDIMVSLLPYIIFGVLIGAVIAKYVPAAIVGTYLSSDFGGMIVATTITLPMFLCSGQEIVILTPLMNQALMGANAVPLGHAIAFTLAGTGICLSSIPVLLSVIGKKATVLLVASFWVGSILLGLIINAVAGLPWW